MAKNLDKNKNEQLFLIFVFFLTLILLLLISYNFSSLFTGPDEWNWKYQPAKTYGKLWFPVSLLIILIPFIFYILNYKKKITLKNELVILPGLVALSYIFLLSIANLYKMGIMFLSFRICEESTTSFFNVTVNFHKNIKYFFANYPDLMPQFPIHAQTHPPGPIIFFWAINSFFERIPFITKPLFNILSANNSFLVKFSEAQALGAVFSSLLIPLLGCSAIIPVYYLGKKFYSQQIAILSASIYCFIPAIALMSPFLDLTYTLLSTSIIFFFLTGLKEKKMFYSFISGALLALGLFFTFKIFIVLLLLFTILGMLLFRENILTAQVLNKLLKEKTKKILFPVLILVTFTAGYFLGIKIFIILLTVEFILYIILYQEGKLKSEVNYIPSKSYYLPSYGFLLKFLLILPIAPIALFSIFYISYDFNIIKVYFTSEELHGYVTGSRTYLLWLFFNLYDFFIFLGIPITLILFKRFYLESKRLINIDFILASFLFTIFFLNISGKVLGEVSRIWMLIMPFALFPVSKELLSNNWHRLFQIILTIILLFLQIVVFREFIQIP